MSLEAIYSSLSALQQTPITPAADHGHSAQASTLLPPHQLPPTINVTIHTYPQSSIVLPVQDEFRLRSETHEKNAQSFSALLTSINPFLTGLLPLFLSLQKFLLLQVLS
jgi:hypothetical protein